MSVSTAKNESTKTIKTGKIIKSRSPKKATFSSAVSQSERVPGPLNLRRLSKIQDNSLILTDNDFRFHSSDETESDEEFKKSSRKGRPANGSINGSLNGEKNEMNTTQQEQQEIQTNGSVKVLPHRSKVVEFFDEEDSEKNQPLEIKPKERALIKSNLLKQRQGLPVFQCRTQLLKHIKHNPVTILIGETGSGKSTQIPQILHSAEPHGVIAITQPRRVAAINLAQRVSKEMGCQLGDKVGYAVRFQTKISSSTRIKYLTDGLLVRELMLDNQLHRYSTIILDEAHERSVLTDLLMGLLKVLQKRRQNSRKPLKLIIMSATLDADLFSKFFDNAPVLYVKGKTYPVDRLYASNPVDDIVDAVVQTIAQIGLSEPSGDILAFLPGQEEIDRCVERVNQMADSGGFPPHVPRFRALPLYASLANHLQQQVFEQIPANHRKVIVATNIAETSLTIPGVRYVVDSGLRKVRIWRPELSLDSLLTTAVSQASANQRMGRAGREAPGKCYRLYTETTYSQELSAQTEPEILRCDLASTILTLKRAKVENITDFDWLEKPSSAAINSALLKLYALKALDDSGRITALGNEIAVLPVSPQLAAVLIHASNNDPSLFRAVVDVVACLSVEDLLLNPPIESRDQVNGRRVELFSKAKEYGDLILFKEMYDMYCNISSPQQWCRDLYISYRAMMNVNRVREQLYRYMKRPLPSSTSSSSSYNAQELIKTFLYGYIANTALAMPDRKYRTVINRQQLNIHPGSMMFGKNVEAIMYMEYVYTTKGYARTVSPVRISWLSDIAPHLLSRSIQQ